MKNYSRSFWLTCLSMLLFMISFNLILPEMNDFITRLDSNANKGLIITLFTISSAISRPFSGRLADYIGRKKVMYIGILIACLVCLLYPLSTSVFFFLMLRFVHGFSVGFTPTGATALITDMLPEYRRGMGMGIWGTFISLGIGAGQTLNYPVVSVFGVQGMFIIASILTIVSGLILWNVTESLKNSQKFTYRHLILKWNDVFEPAVFPAAMVMFFSAISSGIIFVISPDFSTFLHIPNKGWFFLFYVLSTILVRLFTGRLSDWLGRPQTLLIGMFVLIFSMILLANSTNIIDYSLASVIFGLATGISSPTLFAWTADLSSKHRRGVGAGTMFIALEFGVMFGSFSTRFFYVNTLESIRYTMYIGALFAFIACLFLLWHLKFRNKKIELPDTQDLLFEPKQVNNL